MSGKRGMMNFFFACEKCGHRCRVYVSRAPKRWVKCGHCGYRFVAVDPEAVDEAVCKARRGSDPLADGYDAQLEGWEMSANPWKKGTEAHRKWAEGWQEALTAEPVGG